MKSIFGVILILAGIVLGLYVGGYVCFYGGIVQIINGIKADFQASAIALGLLRIVGAGMAGALSAMVLIFPGHRML